MKFLADMAISKKTILWLRENDYEVDHLSELGLQKMQDKDILLKARKENYIILTMDLDFSYLVSICIDRFPSVILFRLHDETAENVNIKLNEVLNNCKNEIKTGCIISVNEKNFRIRYLPI